MDDSGGLIVLLVVVGIIIFVIVYVVLPILGIILGIGLLVLGAVALAGSVTGIGVGAKNFWQTRIKALSEAKSAAEAAPFPPTTTSALVKRLNKYPQPAFLMNIYDKNWYVMRYTGRNVWSNTGVSAQTWFQRGADWWARAAALPSGRRYWPLKFWQWAGGVGAYLGGAFHYVAAVLIVAVFIIFQLIVVGAGAIVTSVLMLGLDVYNWAYSRYYRIYFRCPDCHEEMDIPIYICPDCGTKHDHLWPSIYGVFHHTCRGKKPDGSICYASLPTIDWLGRGENLTQQCPNSECNHELVKAIGHGTNFHIPLVGGPNAGKSNYLVAAVQQLKDEFASQHKLAVSFPDERQEKDFDQNINLLHSGKRLEKTTIDGENASAYNLEMKRTGQRVPSLFYIYDIAGDYFSDEEGAMRQSFFKFVHGVILVIDPFSIEMVRDAYDDQLSKASKVLTPSEESVENVYERMLQVFESKFNLKRGQKFPHPIAVIITKVDAFDLEKQIGLPAALEYMKTHPEIRLEDDAINILAENFLIDNGVRNLVTALENQFRSVRYFTASSIGMNATDGYQPVRVLDPLLWLMDQMRILPPSAQRTHRLDLVDEMVSKKKGGGMISSLRHYIWDSLQPVEMNINS